MKVEDSEENQKLCLCPGCPTYNDCMNKAGEKLFCAIGKTSCELQKQGCLCGECPVSEKYGLSELYFCTKELKN